MKSIHTLVPDIYQVIKEKPEGWFSEEVSKRLSEAISGRLREALAEDQRRGSLRLSRLGPMCPHALWHSVHRPELAEQVPPWVQIKFCYGHILEQFVISLAKASGHHVCGEQDELTLNGIVGHRDCVIDGCTVDVKSASSLSFKKFKGSDFEASDMFGYLDQLDAYVLAAANDPLVTVKDKGYLLAIDKQLGHMVTYEHTARLQHIAARAEHYKAIVALASPPPCECRTEEVDTSGNRRLDIKASYSDFKWVCFPELRAFAYAHGPQYFSKVVKRPRNQIGLIPELDKFGNIVYN